MYLSPGFRELSKMTFLTELDFMIPPEPTKSEFDSI
mgnify:CR=1 FL=1